MSRVIPILSQKLMEASSSGDAILAFVTITHPNTPDIVRLVVDAADFMIAGQTFYASYFELNLLTDTEAPPSAEFSFPNVDRRAITLMRLVNSPPRVQFDLYSSEYFNLENDPRDVKDGLTLEPVYSAKSLYLTRMKATPSTVSGTLRSWDYRQETWPDKRVSQALLPGAYVR